MGNCSHPSQFSLSNWPASPHGLGAPISKGKAPPISSSTSSSLPASSSSSSYPSSSKSSSSSPSHGF
eukprot:5512258-Karenia_brevis.AAC.1